MLFVFKESLFRFDERYSSETYFSPANIVHPNRNFSHVDVFIDDVTDVNDARHMKGYET